MMPDVSSVYLATWASSLSLSLSFSPVWAQKLEIVPQQFAWGLGIFHKNQYLASQFIIYVWALVLKPETLSLLSMLSPSLSTRLWLYGLSPSIMRTAKGREGRRESTREN